MSSARSSMKSLVPKLTSDVHCQMSAFDPKRTSQVGSYPLDHSALQPECIDVRIMGDDEDLAEGDHGLGEMYPVRDRLLACVELLSGFGVEGVEDEITHRHGAEFRGVRGGDGGAGRSRWRPLIELLAGPELGLQGLLSRL